MNTRPRVLSILGYPIKIDWKLLLFLLLFLNVKLVIKLSALIVVYILQPNFKTGFRIKNSRLPLFYPAVVLIALFDYFLYRGFMASNYTPTFLIGIGFWLACILALHQVKLFVDNNTPEVIYHTLIAFFLINAAFSLAEIFKIVAETGVLNPYRYQGEHQKYFISTGDYIKGITLDTSTTNGVLNAFGVIFFLFRKNMAMVILCMAVLVLTASNTTNLLLAATLHFLFTLRTDRDQKSIIIACFSVLIIFLSKISPQNNSYISHTYAELIEYRKEDAVIPLKDTPLTKRPDSLLNSEQKKQKLAMLYLDSIQRLELQKKQTGAQTTAGAGFVSFETRPEIPQPNIHTEPYQSRNDTGVVRKELIDFFEKEKMPVPAAGHLPGKVLAMRQTLAFLKAHPSKLISGCGTGNFSSKLAFRATGLKIAGGYPTSFNFINTGFRENHLNLYAYFFSKPAGFHSVMNSPNSVYDQMASEYGLLGVAALGFLYFGYFLRKAGSLSYGLPLLLLLTGLFFIDYWFEQLSIVVFFELLIFLDKKEGNRNYE